MIEKTPLLQSKVNRLLERPTDNDYTEEWTAILREEREKELPHHIRKVIVFRLGGEWFSLPAEVFFEVASLRVIRRLPHFGGILRGLVNLRGQLCLCVDLAKLLEIEAASVEEPSAKQKIASIEKDRKKWVFVADEILGLFPCDYDRLGNIPVTVAKSTANYLKGTADFEGKHASLIDEELLFCALERRLG